MKVLEDTPAVLSLRKLCDEHGYSYECINDQKTHLIKNGIRIQCNTENFVPIVVPGLSTSFSSSFPSSTSMTPSSRKLIIPRLPQARLPHQPWHLRLCQAKVWLDKNGEDPCQTDHHPAAVSSKHVERKNRALLKSQKSSCWLNQPKTQNQIKMRITSEYGETRTRSYIPKWLQKFRENLVDGRVPEHRDSHAVLRMNYL